MHFVVASINTSNFFITQETEPDYYEGVEGIDFQLLEIFSEVLNFTYELVSPQDRAFGSLKKSGNWTGIIGMLKKDEADMAVNYIALTYARSKVADFSFPYVMDVDSFMMKKAGAIAKDFFLIRPVQSKAWSLMVMLLLLCSMFLSYLQHPNLCKNRLNLVNVFSAMETLLGSRGIGKLFSKTSTRVFFAFTTLPLRVLMLGITGFLLSFLMKPIMEHQITTVEELAAASRMGTVKVIVFKGTQLHLVFKQAETGILRDLAENLRTYPKSRSVNEDDGINKVLQGYTLMDARLYLMMLVQAFGKGEQIFVSRDVLKLSPISMFFRKNFCCIKDFDRIILRLYQSGIYHKLLQNKYFQIDTRRKRKSSVKEYVKSTTIADLFAVFKLLSFGYALAVIVLILEKIHRKWKKSRRNSKVKTKIRRKALRK